MGKQDTGRRQTKVNTQHRELKRYATRAPPKKPGGEPKCSRRVSSSYFFQTRLVNIGIDGFVVYGV
jgi:hypothetical protein